MNKKQIKCYRVPVRKNTAIWWNVLTSFKLWELTHKGHHNRIQIRQTLLFPFPLPHCNFRWHLNLRTSTEQATNKTKNIYITFKPRIQGHLTASPGRWFCYLQDKQSRHSYNHQSVCNVVAQCTAKTCSSIQFWGQQQHCRVGHNNVKMTAYTKSREEKNRLTKTAEYSIVT